jgi:hypothetical protein
MHDRINMNFVFISQPSLSLAPPCRNLCVNTLRGCVSDLVKLAAPWKHAMNSIRTAVRMLVTKQVNIYESFTLKCSALNEITVSLFSSHNANLLILLILQDSGCQTPASADSFLSFLTTWREPLQWLDSGCEEMPQDNCYNGKEVVSKTHLLILA